MTCGVLSARVTPRKSPPRIGSFGKMHILIPWAAGNIVEFPIQISDACILRFLYTEHKEFAASAGLSESGI